MNFIDVTPLQLQDPLPDDIAVLHFAEKPLVISGEDCERLFALLSGSALEGRILEFSAVGDKIRIKVVAS